MIVALAALCAALLATPAGACQPCPVTTEEDSLRQAELVVVGIVTDLDTLFSDAATVRVEQALKGDAAGTLTLREYPDNPCTAHLLEGHRYRLYLVKADDDGLWVKIHCARNARLSAEPVLPWWRVHNEGLTLAGLVTAAVLLAVAIIWVRRRRDRRPSAP